LSRIFASWDGGEIVVERANFVEVLFMVEFISRLQEDISVVVGTDFVH
jgi:hypothetical protein